MPRKRLYGPGPAGKPKSDELKEIDTKFRKALNTKRDIERAMRGSGDVSLKNLVRLQAMNSQQLRDEYEELNRTLLQLEQSRLKEKGYLFGPVPPPMVEK